MVKCNNLYFIIGYLYCYSILLKKPDIVFGITEHNFLNMNSLDK